MKEFVARLISQSKDSQRAQVVIVLEIGGKKRSETRHVVSEGGRWVSYNPDPLAIAVNNAAEDTVAAAKSGVANLTAKLEELRAEAEPDAEAVRKAEIALVNAGASLEEVSRRYTAVQAEYPLKVAFKF